MQDLMLHYTRRRNGICKVIYNWQKRFHSLKNIAPLTYSCEDFVDWMRAQDNFDDIYDDWLDHDFDKAYRPHVARHDYNQGYELKNCFLTRKLDYSERNQVIKNQTRTGSKAVRGVSIATGEEMIFPSQGDAALYFDSPKGTSNISRCCNGHIKSAYGFRWEYIKK